MSPLVQTGRSVHDALKLLHHGHTVVFAPEAFVRGRVGRAASVAGRLRLAVLHRSAQGRAAPWKGPDLGGVRVASRDRGVLECELVEGCRVDLQAVLQVSGVPAEVVVLSLQFVEVVGGPSGRCPLGFDVCGLGLEPVFELVV